KTTSRVPNAPLSITALACWVPRLVGSVMFGLLLLGRGTALAELVGGRSSIEAPGGRHVLVPRKPLPRTGALTALGPAVPVVSVFLYIPGSDAGAPLPGDEVLSPQPEAFDQRAVAGDVGALQVVQQPAAPADEQQQAPAAVVVVLVHLEVLGQVGDP